MKKILVLDTNVLLTEPQAMYRFPNALVVIPQTVLQELDKIKMTRADKTLQYNGRLVSRYLFSISAAGNLVDGVELENNSIIQVGALDSKITLPSSLRTKFSDDQILALAYQLQERNKESDVIIVTNDLNMLIKAQSLGLKIEYHTGLSSSSKLKRFFSNQIATVRKNPVIALFFTLTLAGIIAIIVVLSTVVGAPNVKGPPEIVAQVQMLEAKESQYKKLLDQDSNDQRALFGLAETYVQMGNYYQDSEYYSKAIDTLEQSSIDNGDYRKEAMIARLHFYLGMDSIAYSDISKIVKTKSNQAATALVEQGRKLAASKNYNLAITFFNKALLIRPKDNDIRLDLVEAYYANNQIDQTVDQLHKALAIDRKDAVIYYNLGLVYWQKKADATTAISYFEKSLELQPRGKLAKQAQDNIKQIKKQLRG